MWSISYRLAVRSSQSQKSLSKNQIRDSIHMGSCNRISNFGVTYEASRGAPHGPIFKFCFLNDSDDIEIIQYQNQIAIIFLEFTMNFFRHPSIARDCFLNSDKNMIF